MKNIFKTKNAFSQQKRSDLIFYLLFIALPITQLIIFYFVVNFNSILLAFEKITFSEEIGENGGYLVQFCGFDNFGNVFNEIFGTNWSIKFRGIFWNTFKTLFFNILFETPLGLLFSYYIYKKMKFSGFFRVILFLPSIISGVVLIVIYQFFVNDLLSEVLTSLGVKEFYGLTTLTNIEYNYWAALGYTLFMGFGTSTLLYSSTMSGISESIVEAAQVDGVSPLQEFFYITFPLVYSTISIFIITTFAGLFSNQLNLFIFFKADRYDSPQVSTIGYYLYVESYVRMVSDNAYPRLSTFGLLLTAISIPLTFTVRAIMKRIGKKWE